MDMAGKQEIRTGNAPAPGGTYSQGLVVGDFLYTAGMGPIDPGTGDVVKATVHLQELHRDFAAYDAVYRSYFRPPFPVRTTVGSDLMNILVEIDLVAYLGS
jgi:2-iminobutanoate/2-iminopropanoate deaminase